MSSNEINPSLHVAVVGGGLAGLSASVVLAGEGVRISLLEKQPRLGGRATSYTLATGECIDNCQHVTLRCCTNLADFYSRIGVSADIRYHDRLIFADAKGRRGIIRSSGLPAPLHTALSFAAFPLLGVRDKVAIANAMLRIVRCGGQISGGATTMLDWLRRNRQPQSAIERFWRVVLVSALNEQLDRMDAGYGVAVFWKAFLANSDGFGVGVPAVPLEALYASAAKSIQRTGGAVRTRCGAAGFCLKGETVDAVRLDDGETLRADRYIAAPPFDRLLRLLPEETRALDPFRRIAKFTFSPITSIHLWFDRPVMAEPFLTSLDHTVQWVFNKSAGQYVQAVVSASHEWAQRSQQEIVESCRNDLKVLIPAAADAKLLRTVVIRESAATFSPRPGCDEWRPAAVTPIKNLFLAGDWTRTGWPATMESAVRSGYLAAEALLAAEGRTARFVCDELPPTGLSKYWAKT